MVVSCGNSTADLQMSEDALDAVVLAIELLVVVDDRFDAAPLQVIADGIGIVSLIGQERLRLSFRQVDQIVVSLAVRRFSRREVEGDGATSSITETVNFTGEPAPRAAKSSSMNPPFPPAAETWARMDVESIL